MVCVSAWIWKLVKPLGPAADVVVDESLAVVDVCLLVTLVVLEDSVARVVVGVLDVVLLVLLVRVIGLNENGVICEDVSVIQ